MRVQIKSLGTFAFSDTLPSPQGAVPFLPLGSMMPNGMNVLCGLPKDRSYEPGTHPYPCMVIVLEGQGRFVVGEQVHNYAAGSVYRVGADVRHGFVWVAEATAFIKQVSKLKRQPR